MRDVICVMGRWLFTTEGTDWCFRERAGKAHTWIETMKVPRVLSEELRAGKVSVM